MRRKHETDALFSKR